jgi:hypothetical protein
VEKRSHVVSLDPLPGVREWTTRCRALIRGSQSGIVQISASLGRLYRVEQTALAASEAAVAAGSLHFQDAFSDHTL